MSSAPRIDVDTARARVEAGQALLVCAYDDEQKCRGLGVEGGMSLADLEARQVGRDQEIIFYCA